MIVYLFCWQTFWSYLGCQSTLPFFLDNLPANTNVFASARLLIPHDFLIKWVLVSNSEINCRTEKVPRPNQRPFYYKSDILTSELSEWTNVISSGNSRATLPFRIFSSCGWKNVNISYYKTGNNWYHWHLTYRKGETFCKALLLIS
jgi:hypothetical protein